MITAIVLDDEPHALQLLQNYCRQSGLINCSGTFTSATAANAYLTNHAVDLVFLDIHMPEVNGLAFRQLIGDNTMVIFATASGDHAAEGFNLDAVDYLLKPFSYDRFLRAANKAVTRYTCMQKNVADTKQDLLLKTGYSLVKIPLKKILYIESLNDYLRIFMDDGKPLLTLKPIKDMEAELENCGFARVHRSYIVSLNKINYIRRKLIYLDKYEIPIGNLYKDRFYDQIGMKN